MKKRPVATTTVGVVSVLPGELSTGVDDDKARQHFQHTLGLARTATDKNAIHKKIHNPGAST